MSLKIFACACSLMIGLARATVAAPAAMPPWTHALPLNAEAIHLLTEAAERSPLVTTLLQDLERTDVVVYLADMLPGRPADPSSYLTFLSKEGATRYLMIRIDAWKVTRFERICLLGHELQHALEVAGAPDVLDAESLATLYRRIGWESGQNRFETTAARSMGYQVKAQLFSTMSKGSRKADAVPGRTAETTAASTGAEVSLLPAEPSVLESGGLRFAPYTRFASENRTPDLRPDHH
ncbi:MAG: hypothetical protein ABI672_05655 [Vicinamibacteria bacterium]